MSQQRACRKRVRRPPPLSVDHRHLGMGDGCSPLSSALQGTKTYPGSHKASAKGHPLPCFPISPCRFHEAPALGNVRLPFCQLQETPKHAGWQELTRPRPWTDVVRHIAPASPMCVCALGAMAWHSRALGHELIPTQCTWGPRV